VQGPHPVEVPLQAKRTKGQFVSSECTKIRHCHGICSQVEEVECISHVK